MMTHIYNARIHCGPHGESSSRRLGPASRSPRRPGCRALPVIVHSSALVV